MKHSDFMKIIDLKAEYKEYKRFVSGKSKKYLTYADWDAHIEALLLGCKASTDLYNLKRHCLSIVRANDNSASIIWGYMGLAFPLVLMFSTEKDRIGWTGFLFMLTSMVLLMFVINAVNIKAREKHFYEDILNIIEQIENQP